MSEWYETAEAAEFVATAGTRNTSVQIMLAIAFFARNIGEAEMLWNGDGIGAIASISDIWENATNNGLIDDAELYWGDRPLANIICDLAN
jgi:hypothetical protein